jgi:hypothetical protein
MLDDYADAIAVPESMISPAPQRVPDPDLLVVESARVRLAERYAAPAGQHRLQPPAAGEPGQPPAAAADDGLLLPADPTDDVRAVIAVIKATGVRGADQADALDVGASLVLLLNLRGYLDRLEADLLDTIENVGLTWDVIAAIMGIPAAAAQRHHAVLRARRHPW